MSNQTARSALKFQDFLIIPVYSFPFSPNSHLNTECSEYYRVGNRNSLAIRPLADFKLIKKHVLIFNDLIVTFKQAL